MGFVSIFCHSLHSLFFCLSVSLLSSFLLTSFFLLSFLVFFFTPYFFAYIHSTLKYLVLIFEVALVRHTSELLQIKGARISSLFPFFFQCNLCLSDIQTRSHVSVTPSFYAFTEKKAEFKVHRAEILQNFIWFLPLSHYGLKCKLVSFSMPPTLYCVKEDHCARCCSNDANS